MEEIIADGMLQDEAANHAGLPRAGWSMRKACETVNVMLSALALASTTTVPVEFGVIRHFMDDS